MHHSVTLFSAAVITAAVLCGCAAGNAASVTFDKAEYETDAATVYVEKPKFSFMKNRELMERLNGEYESEIDSALVAFDTKAREAPPLEGGNKYVFEIHQDLKYNRSGFISVVSEAYEYTGGAHGSTVWSAKNIDTVSGTELALADLFADEGYADALDRLITEEIEEDPGEYSDLWEKPRVKESNQRDFYVSDDGLVIFYQPYDLSYYARGLVEFEIDFEDISGYLKEEYRRLVPE